MQNRVAVREEKINFRDNISYYLNAAKPYWLMFAVVIFLILIISLIDVGTNLIFKELIDRGTLFAAGELSKEEFIGTIFFLASIFFSATILLALAKYFRMNFLNALEVKMMFDVKKDIFDHLLRLSHNFHTTNRTGSIISKLIRSSKGIEALTDFITFHGSPLILKVIVIFGFILFFDFQSAIVTLIVVIVFMAYSLYVLGKQQKVNLNRNETEDIEKGFISDVFTNIETIKHFGKESRISEMFSDYAKNTQKMLLEFWNYYSGMEVGLSLTLGFGSIFLMYFTLSRLLAGEISVGTVAFIYTSYIGLIMPLFEFMWGVRRTYEAMSDIQAIVEYKKIVTDVADIKGAKPLKVKRGFVEFDDVSFSYGRKPILKNFSLKIKPNEKIAFVGHSGAGKSTVVKLLYRLYDVTGGKISIDGKNVSEVTQESLRSELSIVPQECILFNDSIYNNILFSNPQASRKDVFAAMKISQLESFVNSLPEKENTIVGERGIKLSGGEKQRLSIARAVLADKKILVLDEATSSLDSSTEYIIQEALWKLMKGRTAIIIAHRLSTIMRADRIVVIGGGKIIQEGKHDDLIKQKGLYQKLWKLQKDGVLVE